MSAVSTVLQERGPDYGLVRRSDVHFYVRHNRKTESYHKNKSQVQVVPGSRINLIQFWWGHLVLVIHKTNVKSKSGVNE